MLKLLDKRYLGLLREIVVSQFRLKDQSTFFGFLWSFLHPLIMLIFLFLFFNWRIGREIEHYALYLLIGIIHYTHFSNSTNASMSVLSGMRQLTCNTILPKEVLVIGSVITNTIEFIISMVFCILMAYVSGVRLSWTVMLLPLVFLLQLTMVLWVSFALSCLCIFVKDIGHIYQVFLRLLFFVTPIFYANAFLEGKMAKHIVLLNPLAYFMAFSRAVVIEGNLFSIKLFVILLSLNTLFIYVAFKIFKKQEPLFAEYV
jgi:lipopolysaccharide transport system permease protein